MIDKRQGSRAIFIFSILSSFVHYRVQSRGGHLDLLWTVRWTPIKKPSQRFTLLLWRSVRNLEMTLNRDQPEPYLYIIDNKEVSI